MRGEKLDLKKVGRLKPHPIFKKLPAKLKDPACYAGIEQQLRAVIYSDHKHPNVKAFVGCERCLAKLEKRQQIMRDLGFASISQYREWKRIMSIIIGQQNIQLR